MAKTKTIDYIIVRSYPIEDFHKCNDILDEELIDYSQNSEKFVDNNFFLIDIKIVQTKTEINILFLYQDMSK